MTKEQFAALLNGREMLFEISSAEEVQAAQLGLVVLFGGSDDLAEFRGAITDEGDVYDGGDLFVHQDGLVCVPEEETETVLKCAKIEAVWDSEGYSWTYKTDIPHATFDILEDGEKYCRGIVFNLSDLPKL